MTRIFTDGAESGDTRKFSTVVGTSSSIAAYTSTKRTGAYSYRFWYIYGPLYMYRTLSASYTEFYCRFAANISGGVPYSLFSWYNTMSNIAGSLRITAYGANTGYFTVYDGNTLRATSPAFTLIGGEWHLWEIHVKMAADPNGIIEVKYDGVPLLSFTGATNAQASMDTIMFACTTQDNCATYFDDIALNDTAGGVDNSWCGDGGVLAALVPMTGAAEYSDLIASTGNAWDCVNEMPVNTTDYVYESTVDKKSTYIMTDLASLAAGTAIKRVWVELNAVESSPEGGKIATLLRSGTTDTQGVDQTLGLTYASFNSSEYLVDPADSAAWTEAKVNALQAGAVVR
jgi:hypothetical protein